MITIELDDNVIEVGQIVKGNVHWQVDGRPPKAIHVALRYKTEGRGTEEGDTVAEMEQDIDGDSSFTTPWLPFEFVVPSDGPVSYEGNLIRLLWAITVELDIPWARDEESFEPIWVVPVNA